MRIAVVGGGPRALWALESVLQAVREGGHACAIDVFDPHPDGRGSAYASGQPDYLRLNVNSAIIRTGLGSLDGWRADRGERRPLDPFPARSLVGRFLSESWDAAERTAGRCAPRRIAARVTRVEPSGSAWLVAYRPGPEGAPAEHEGRYDHVLLATGHETAWRDAWRATQPDALPALPVSGLTDAAVPAGARVAVRGAALTFIDAALALTEGRGGTFAADGYQPSGREPRLLPFGRGGRFLECKPQPGGPLAGLDLTSARMRGAVALAESRGDPDAVARAVAATAEGFLRAAHGRGDVDAVLAGRDAGDPVADLRRSYAVATGDARPHAAWAVGQAWRDLYPAIVDAVGYERCPVARWPAFARLARRLERVAFGPPPVNAGKLLALVNAGVVAAPASACPPAARHVDAVLAPPGVVPGSLAASLVDRGIAACSPGRRGLRVTGDAAVVGPGGRPHRGLAAVGRVTEDVVIGNDTLSRTLHDAIPRWARRVVRDA